jgi:ABC-type sugar transport system substrate-binding protein
MLKAKWLVVLVCLVNAASAVTGCASSGEPRTSASGDTAASSAPAAESGAPAAPAAGGVYKVGYVPTMIGQPVTNAWMTGMERVFSQFDNIEFQAFDPQMKAETQVSMVEDLINQGYNAIVLQPVDAAALSAAVQDAEEKGIAVVTLNTPVKAKHTAVVQMADVEAGYAVGAAMCQQLNNEGNVAIIQSPPGATLGVNREKGFRDALAANCPNVKIVSAQNGEWNKDKAITIMNSFLQANADLDGVFAVNDTMAEGAIVAAESAGRLQDIKIWGANGQNSALALIEQGKMAGTAYNNSYDQGATAANLIMYLLSSKMGPGKGPETGVIKITPFAATQENVGEIQQADRW